jgi:diadenosine tetraphosphate (Ap4A) HIT family hydrolase
MYRECPFCSIRLADMGQEIVVPGSLTMTVACRHAPHAGHFLVAPRQHCRSLRALDEAGINALIQAVSRVVQALDLELPGAEIDLWKSVDDGGHVHFHVHAGHPPAGSPAAWFDPLCRRLRKASAAGLHSDGTAPRWCDCPERTPQAREANGR